MHSQTPVWVYFLPLVLVAVGYLIASQRKGSVAGAAVGHRRLELTSAGAARALAALACCASCSDTSTAPISFVALRPL
jgi:hypothetical protein